MLIMPFLIIPLQIENLMITMTTPLPEQLLHLQMRRKDWLLQEANQSTHLNT